MNKNEIKRRFLLMFRIKLDEYKRQKAEYGEKSWLIAHSVETINALCNIAIIFDINIPNLRKLNELGCDY